MQRTIVWVTLLVFMNVCWAGSYSVVKIGLDTMDPYALVYWRFLVPLIILLFPALRFIRNIEMSGIDSVRIIFAGVLIAVSHLLWVVGTGMSFATDASLLYVFEPIWGIFLASIFLKERLLWTTIVGLVFVFAGLAALSNFNLKIFGFGGGASFGNLLIMMGLICEALFSITVKPIASKYPSTVITAVTLAVAVLALSFPQLARGEFLFPTSTKEISAILYLGIVCTVIGYTLWVQIMKIVPVGMMLFSIFIQPLAGPVIAALVLGEKIDSRVVTGGILLMLGMLVAVIGHQRCVERTSPMQCEGVVAALENI